MDGWILFATLAVWLGCAGGATNSRTTRADALPRAAAASPPAARPVEAVPVREAAPDAGAAPVASAEPSDLHPGFQLSSSGDRRSHAVWRHEFPSAPPTASPPAKPAPAFELRAGPNPTQQVVSDASLAKTIADRGKYAHCGLSANTRVDAHATVYDGAAVEVSASTVPANAVLSFCIEQAVRGISWPRELQTRRLDVTF